jgi:hypothetical protein
VGVRQQKKRVRVGHPPLLPMQKSATRTILHVIEVSKMNCRAIACLLFATVCCVAATGAESSRLRFGSMHQVKSSETSTDAAFDPLQEITSSFPKSVKLNEKRRLLEFCPDETCDGFVASNEVSMASLKDFAYLYVYFFSDYLVYLPEWRNRDESKHTAERVLSKPEFLSCKSDNSRDAARCVLLS